MYGIFTYISDKNQPNVGEYTTHGALGDMDMVVTCRFFVCAYLSIYGSYLYHIEGKGH